MSLPPEILSTIFILYIKLTATPEFLKENNPRLPQVWITSVCRFWREVACNTSQLWSTCWLNYNATEFNSRWLGRASKHSLLDLIGVVSDPRQSDWERPLDTSSLNRLLDSIDQFIPRCRSFSIDNNLLDRHEQVETREYVTPHLVSCEFLGFFSPPWFLQVLRGAPNLQHLHTDINEVFLPIITFPNLTYLRVRTLSHMSQLLHFMKSAPKLRTLVLDDPAYESDPRGTLIHNSLKHLTLWFSDTDDIAIILDPFIFPSLQTLDLLTRQGGFDVEGIAPLFDFLERSQCMLQELKTDGYWGNSLFPILQHPTVSSLEVLSCTNTVLDDVFLVFLTDIANLPQLRVLIIGEIYRDDLSLFLDMLRARRRRNDQTETGEGSRLERVKMVFPLVASLTREGDPEEEATRIRTVAGVSGVAVELEGHVN